MSRKCPLTSSSSFSSHPRISVHLSFCSDFCRLHLACRHDSSQCARIRLNCLPLASTFVALSINYSGGPVLVHESTSVIVDDDGDNKCFQNSKTILVHSQRRVQESLSCQSAAVAVRGRPIAVTVTAVVPMFCLFLCACRVRRYRGLFTDASEEDHLLSLSVCPRDPRPVCPQRPTFRARVPKARFRARAPSVAVLPVRIKPILKHHYGPPNTSPSLHCYAGRGRSQRRHTVERGARRVGHLAWESLLLRTDPTAHDHILK